MKWFDGKCNGEKYVNPKKHYESYMISFSSGPQLEIMKRTDVTDKKIDPLKEQIGLAHFAFALQSKEEIDKKVSEMKINGVKILDGPRTTGDGYYEAVFFDPDENRVEITFKL